ncbi:MAG: hypothetical protein AMQ74_01954 [Candidatus Methanofastidiosum methylothiophilum]|uniref:Uncharacterized protein n=1 Tax=Candidatus Methanofastidiosum methylothiophilum TaxID=1705564 RepID=A0A150II83_9EURY|nr:MAG: hypothetical protein AMQ74_01954 [Candidatus Methanofastidiosum methylthiophilus]
MKRLFIFFILFLAMGCVTTPKMDSEESTRTYQYDMPIVPTEYFTFQIQEEGYEVWYPYDNIGTKTYEDFLVLKDQIFPEVELMVTYGQSAPVYYPQVLSQEVIKKIWEDYIKGEETEIFITTSNTNYYEIETYEKPLQIPITEVEEEFEISKQYLEWAESDTRLVRTISLGFSRFGVVKIIRYGKEIDGIYKVKGIRRY